MFVCGFLIQKFWEWFIIPMFGLRVLSLPMAMGLGLFVQLITGRFNGKSDSKDTAFELIAEQLGTYTIALFIGYIVHLFM